MPDPIRILVVDDHPMFLDGVILSLNNEHDFEVIGQAATGTQVVSLTVEHLPDILLLDITLPEMDGIQVTQKIADACPATRIVMLTVSEDRDDLLQALKAGAQGYLLKGISSEDLVESLRAIAVGEVRISPSLAGEILFEMTREPSLESRETLTEREREILALLSEGLTNREIGLKLHLAEKTIKHYMSNILQKLHLRSRVEAALWAYRHGIRSGE